MLFSLSIITAVVLLVTIVHELAIITKSVTRQQCENKSMYFFRTSVCRRCETFAWI